MLSKHKDIFDSKSELFPLMRNFIWLWNQDATTSCRVPYRGEEIFKQEHTINITDNKNWILITPKGKPIYIAILQHVWLVLVNKNDKCTRKITTRWVRKAWQLLFASKEYHNMLFEGRLNINTECFSKDFFFQDCIVWMQTCWGRNEKQNWNSKEKKAGLTELKKKET